MSQISLCVRFVVLPAVMLMFATIARAEISPDSIQELKDEASDVLQVKIAKFEKKGADGERLELVYTANVLKVVRSSSGTKVGSTIRIASYRMLVDQPGPKNPPLLPVGWTGTAYLNAGEGGAPFDLAVYGHSFVE